MNPRGSAGGGQALGHKVIHTFCGLRLTRPIADSYAQTAPGPTSSKPLACRPPCPIIASTLRPTKSSHDTSAPLPQAAPGHRARGAGMRAAIERSWQGRGPLACLLWPASLLYGALVRLRCWMYAAGLRRSQRMPVPVVVVGNVVAGGAGKTPVVMALVEHLAAQGWRPGVISRGYGRHTHDCREVLPDAQALEVGDEPLLIRRRCAVPVFVARRRAEAAQALLQAHPGVDILLADDGLQHHALQRDIDIAVFDDRGIGNGWLLPAGPLRQAWHPSQADLVLHSGGSPAWVSWGGFRTSRRLASHALTSGGLRLPLQALQGRRLVAVAGIAKPQQFFDMLHSSGLTLHATQALPDHHDFRGNDLLADPEATVLCTEKDAVKLFTLYPKAGDRLLAVPLQLELEPAFLAALDGLLAHRSRTNRHPLPSGHGHTTS